MGCFVGIGRPPGEGITSGKPSSFQTEFSPCDLGLLKQSLAGGMKYRPQKSRVKIGPAVFTSY
jgi:hypothetical protein